MTGDRDHVTGATGAWVDPQPRKPSTTSTVGTASRSRWGSGQTNMNIWEKY